MTSLDSLSEMANSKGFKEIRSELDQNYLPNVIFLGGKKEGTLSLLKDKLIS